MLRKIALGLVLLIVLGFAVALFLPGEYEVRRSIHVGAAPAAVHALVADLRNWERWTAWNKKNDPSLKREFSGPLAGRGAKMSWQGDKFGKGELTIVESTPPKRVRFTVRFEGGAFDSEDEITFEPQGGGTKVTWSDRGNLGLNPIARYAAAGNWLQDWIGRGIEQGLAGLKALAEGGPGKRR